MTTAATSLLGLALPVTGELSGTWGDTVNNSITSLLDSAVAGTTTISTDGDVTLTTTTLAANQARQAVLLFSGARTALRTVTAPAQSKIYTVINATTGGYAVKLVGVGPTTGLTIPNGASAVVAWNGSDFIEIGTSSIGNLTVNGNLTVTGTTTLSAGTANGVAYLNGSKVLTTGSALVFDGTNLGIGVTPSAGVKLQLPSGELAGWAGTSGYLVSNTYYGSGDFRYVGTGAAARYQQVAGAHAWLTASSGTAGNAITFTQAMTLDASGQLGIGTSSPAAQLHVSVANTNNTLRLQRTGTATGVWSLYLSNNTGSSADLVFYDNTNSRSVMTLDAAGGNVGIGTTSPATRLHLKGATNQVSIKLENPQARTFQILSNGSTGGGGASTGSFAIYDETAGADRLTLDASGNLGIGVTPSAWSAGKAVEIGNRGNGIWTYAGNETYLTGNTYYNAGFKYASSNPASYYSQYNGTHIWKISSGTPTIDTAVTFTQAMTLDANGNLGVGTTSPSAKFNVVGGDVARFESTSNGSVNVYWKNSTQQYSYRLDPNNNGSRDFSIYDDTNSQFVDKYFQGASGYRAFYTNGSERARIDSSGNLLVGKTNQSDAYVGSAVRPDGSFAVGNAGTTNSTLVNPIYSTGASAYRFYVGMAGTVYATSTTITGISDQRLKENIRDLDDGLASVLALKPRKFDWKEGKGANIKNARGFIAQEFETVFPDMIEEWLDPAPEGEEPYKAVNANLIPTLVKAIQEQQAIIEALKSRLDAANL